MAYRFEFDPVNKILLFRLEEMLTDESLGEAYEACMGAAQTSTKPLFTDYPPYLAFVGWSRFPTWARRNTRHRRNYST